MALVVRLLSTEGLFCREVSMRFSWMAGSVRCHVDHMPLTLNTTGAPGNDVEVWESWLYAAQAQACVSKGGNLPCRARLGSSVYMGFEPSQMLGGSFHQRPSPFLVAGRSIWCRALQKRCEQWYGLIFPSLWVLSQFIKPVNSAWPLSAALQSQ